MRLLIYLASVCLFLVFVLCPPVIAGEEIDPGQIVVSPDDYVGRNVTMTVNFKKIDNVFKGWEESAGLKRSTKMKFFVTPLSKIACYVSRVPDNEKILGSLSPRQSITVTGFLKKCKVTTKVKGERETVRRTAKGIYHFAFVVNKIEVVKKEEGAGEGAPPPPRVPGMRRRLRRGL